MVSGTKRTGVQPLDQGAYHWLYTCLFVLGTKFALRSAAELPISHTLLGLRHRFCRQGPISNQRPVLDSPSKTTRGM